MNKVYIIGVLLISIFVMSCGEFKRPQQQYDNVNTGKDFTGDWFWENADSTSSFKINLMKQGDSIIGRYCAAYDKGNRLDCEFNNSKNMYGRQSGDSVILHFYSYYDAKNGLATVRLDNDKKKLVWTITKAPVGGDCFAPKTAIMFRKLNNW